MLFFRRHGRRRSRERFRHYYVTRLVHSGDKSSVFEAAKVTPEAPVAIKLYTKTYDRTAARLELKYGIPSEAEVGMALNPAPSEKAVYPIVTTIGQGREYGKRTGARYIVQEFVQGVSLKHLIACRDPVIEGNTGSFVLQMCRALRTVHKKGFVFRDFCSANVIVQHDGALKLIDLGFVAPVGGAFEERSGTASYMSPEQVRGEPLGLETDVYSLGVVVYELLTGTLPYVSRIPVSDEVNSQRRLAEVMRMHVESPVPELPASVCARARSLCEALPRCLAKHPADRFHSVDELIAALV